MKIVHVEDFFHPDAGYQINVLPKYLAKFGHEQVIITSEMDKIPDNLTQFFGRENIEKRDRKYEEKYHVKIIRLPLHGFVSGRAIFSGKLISAIKGLSPDVLYIHGNDTLTGIRLLLARKRFNCRIVTDSHMLEMASKNPFNTYFRRFYKTLITPILINTWEFLCRKLHGFLMGQIHRSFTQIARLRKIFVLNIKLLQMLLFVFTQES